MRFGFINLSSFSMRVSLATEAEVTFDVYEGSAAEGPFTLVSSHSRTVDAGTSEPLGSADLHPVGVGDYVVLAISVSADDAIVCHGDASYTEDMTWLEMTGKGYEFADHPGGTISTAPANETAWSSVTAFRPL